MRASRIVREGVQSLGANKLRTFFMMAGTIVGIAALTVIMAMGKGTEQNVMKMMNSFGIKAIMVTAGGGKGFSPPQEGITTLRLEDLEAIRSQVQGIELLSPGVMKRGSSIKVGTAQTQATAFAVEPDWYEAWEWQLRNGEPLSAEDMSTMARTCNLGTTLSRTLFGDADPIGEYIQIGTTRFLVKGVLESRGTSPSGGDMDNRVLIPLTTGMRRLLNVDYISYIRVKVKDPKDLVAIGDEIRKILHERHHITPPQEDDFAIVTAADIAKAARGISGTLSILLIALAASGPPSRTSSCSFWPRLWPSPCWGWSSAPSSVGEQACSLENWRRPPLSSPGNRLRWRWFSHSWWVFSSASSPPGARPN
jgi:putative ABC transport system permease protein